MVPSQKGRHLSVNEKTGGVVCWMAWDGVDRRLRRLRSAKGQTGVHGGQR